MAKVEKEKGKEEKTLIFHFGWSVTKLSFTII